MLIKLGVDISRLKRPMRRALWWVEEAYKQYDDEEVVVTSTYEGDHSVRSLHYNHNAVDFRRPKKFREIVARIQDALGNDYDVVLERTHIHVEYDPK